MEAVTLKMEKGLLREIDDTLAEHRYSTRTEFIRDAIRFKLTELEKEEAIKKLTKFKGSFKGKAKMGEEEARDWAFREIAKKFNLKLD